MYESLIQILGNAWQIPGCHVAIPPGVVVALMAVRLECISLRVSRQDRSAFRNKLDSVLNCLLTQSSNNTNKTYKYNKMILFNKCFTFKIMCIMHL